ncbi:nucleotidyltransferase family protein [Pseudomonas sp. CAN2814]|uniref:nucleotidyltransferase family protein n=1 Tax=Pseudomonas sp. CAN1 TaxID=3046726 RepID=UPI0026476C56|nr:nucleotidyltransferase family protein [Pseudomonas sp. CAN1]MDN6856284.1 nucleotidyltransferase family protein [Pseudomonas sp. CAN1]
MPGESELLALIAAQPQRMQLLRAVRDHGPADAWIAAGCVRNAVWDALHDYSEPTPLSDIDVLYFSADSLEPEVDYTWERRLLAACPDQPWSVRNQARMHLRNADSPYRDCGDAMCHWPEVCTAVALRLRGNELELLAPLGLLDIWELRVRPTEHFRAKPHLYRERLAAKNWPARWPKLRIEPL